MAELAQQLPALHRLIDAVALLDMLCSFAVVVRAELPSDLPQLMCLPAMSVVAMHQASLT